MTEEGETKEPETEEEARKKWEEMSETEKINVIANNAISKAEAMERMNSILEKVAGLATRIENVELRQKLAEKEGA